MWRWTRPLRRVAETDSDRLPLAHSFSTLLLGHCTIVIMATTDVSLVTLAEKLDAAIVRIQILEDKNAITELHYKYGCVAFCCVMRQILKAYSIRYYLDKCLYNQAVDLFANNSDARVHFHGGIWKGKEGIRRLYIGRFQGNFTSGRNGPVYVSYEFDTGEIFD